MLLLLMLEALLKGLAMERQLRRAVAGRVRRAQYQRPHQLLMLRRRPQALLPLLLLLRRRRLRLPRVHRNASCSAATSPLWRPPLQLSGSSDCR